MLVSLPVLKLFETLQHLYEHPKGLCLVGLKQSRRLGKINDSQAIDNSDRTNHLH